MTAEGQAQRMDVNALRLSGIAVTGALMAAALFVAAQPLTHAEARPQTAVEVAQAETSAASIGFIVRFRGTGPIARAQALAARGHLQQAQRQVELQLQRQTAFAGLCFDRFTVGGAEIVLRTCEAVAASERISVQQRWGARLQSMRAVEYVDANATVTQNRAPG